MTEFASARCFIAICVRHLQECSLWQWDEQSVWSDCMLYISMLPHPCCCWWLLVGPCLESCCWLACIWIIIATLWLVSIWVVSVAQFKVYGLVLHLELDTKTSLPSGFLHFCWNCSYACEFLLHTDAGKMLSRTESSLDLGHQIWITEFYTSPAKKT